MICIHCEHQFVGGAFIRSSGPGTSVAMRRCPKCNKEFVAPPKLRAPGKIVALGAKIDLLRGYWLESQTEANRLRADNERLLQLLRESRTHLMQGDHSEWRKRVEAALAAKGAE